MRVFRGCIERTARRIAPVAAALLIGPGAALAQGTGCVPVDFLAQPLPAAGGAPIQTALRLAYPDLAVSQDGTQVALPGGAAMAVGGIEPDAPRRWLDAPSIAEQFAQVYPLAFDPAPRLTPYFDPGRFRNQPFFEALWFSSSGAASASLVQVPLTGLAGGQLTVTTKRGVDCQLRAVIAELAAEPGRHAPFLEGAGGGFNWRRIAGTDRLSAHSYGIAVDINAERGGYWRWSGAAEGAVGAYNHDIPESLVAAFERYGFIWGGKWHHFDGMHFEYRPELILHARLVGGTGG